MEISKKSSTFAAKSCHFRQVYKPQNNWKNNMETKIASYQESGIRLQLIKIYELVQQIKHDQNFNPIKTDHYAENNVHYQIRKNRKVLCNMKCEEPARKKFNSLIQQELLQTKITYNDKKNRYMCNTVGGYILYLETGQQIKIEDNEVEIIAARYNLKKQNDNYYIYDEK